MMEKRFTEKESCVAGASSWSRVEMVGSQSARSIIRNNTILANSIPSTLKMETYIIGAVVALSSGVLWGSLLNV